jgi:hypothetical protein
MNKQEVLYLPVKKEGRIFSTDNYECKIFYRTLDSEEVSSSFKAKSKEELLDQLKPVVPNFVAEWIEDHKGDYNKWDEEAKADFVFRSINDLFRFGEGLNPFDFTIDEKFSEWTNKSAYEFIIAILFGYEVEKEPLYTVEIPDPNSVWKYTFLTNRGPGVSIDRTDGDFWKDDSKNQLTEAEIRKDFEWAWQWA